MALMIALSVSAVPAHLRGSLTRWLLEVTPQLYVGTVSAKVRDELWASVVACGDNGVAFLAYPAANEQGFELRMTGTQHRRPVDLDGLTLIAFNSTNEAGQEVAKQLKHRTSKRGPPRAGGGQPEVREARGDLGLADGEVSDSGLLGEGSDRLNVGGLDRAVVADRFLRTGVDTSLVAVGGIVLGDPVVMGQHVTRRAARVCRRTDGRYNGQLVAVSGRWAGRTREGGSGSPGGWGGLEDRRDVITNAGITSRRAAGSLQRRWGGRAGWTVSEAVRG